MILNPPAVTSATLTALSFNPFFVNLKIPSTPPNPFLTVNFSIENNFFFSVFYGFAMQ
jgi:hypothetical protein